MLANLLALVTVLLPIVQAEFLAYQTKAMKGLKDSDLDYTRGPFYIPDNQCSGVINPELICVNPYAVSVTVTDSQPFAVVKIDNRLKNVTILRAPDTQGLCEGKADVRVRLACWGSGAGGSPAGSGRDRREARAERAAPLALPRAPDAYEPVNRQALPPAV